MATPVLWKDVVGFEGLYIVSNFGEIRSVDHYVKCNSGKRLVKGRTLKPCDRCALPPLMKESHILIWQTTTVHFQVLQKKILVRY